ncbi:MAG: ABC transporter permease [Planctomycetes bacterium]|nr:ABC transporter permease [Planctomycetota bacterium]
MLSSLWAIVRNSFVEIIRQPIYGILLVVGIVLIAFSPLITMFTMMEDVKLAIDMGLGTIFMVGIVLSILSATQVISREIEAKTAGAVISKPVGRFIFVAGKFLGVTCAMALASFLFTLMLLMTVRMGVPTTASFKVDWPVFLAEVLPLVLAFGVGVYANYFYRSNFTATAVFSGLILYSFAFICLLFISKDWSFEWIAVSFASKGVWPVFLACVLVFLGVWMIASVAVASSTRVNVVANVLICLLVFFVGMLSNYLFGWTVNDTWVRWAPQGDSETALVSGTVVFKDGSPLKGVEMLGIPRNPVTDSSGRYSARVVKGGSGTIRPRKFGLEFNPPERHMDDLEKARPGQNFEARFSEDGILLYVKSGWFGICWTAYHVVPSQQLFWVADQLMRPDPIIPVSYVLKAGGYACVWCVAMVAFGAFLFERREII